MAPVASETPIEMFWPEVASTVLEGGSDEGRKVSRARKGEGTGEAKGEGLTRCRW